MTPSLKVISIFSKEKTKDQVIELEHVEVQKFLFLKEFLYPAGKRIGPITSKVYRSMLQIKRKVSSISVIKNSSTMLML